MENKKDNVENRDGKEEIKQMEKNIHRTHQGALVYIIIIAIVIILALGGSYLDWW